MRTATRQRSRNPLPTTGFCFLSKAWRLFCWGSSRSPFHQSRRERDRHPGLPFSPQRSARIGDNLLGAAGTGTFVVAGICLAGDIRRCGTDRKQIAGFVRRYAGLAVSRRRPAAVDFGSFLPCRGRRLDHVRARTPASFFDALGLHVCKRCRGHCFGQHHHLCVAGDLRLDFRASDRDQHDFWWLGSGRNRIARPNRMGRCQRNSAAKVRLDPMISRKIKLTRPTRSLIPERTASAPPSGAFGFGEYSRRRSNGASSNLWITRLIPASAETMRTVMFFGAADFFGTLGCEQFCAAFTSNPGFSRPRQWEINHVTRSHSRYRSHHFPAWRL